MALNPVPHCHYCDGPAFTVWAAPNHIYFVCKRCRPRLGVPTRRVEWVGNGYIFLE